MIIIIRHTYIMLSYCLHVTNDSHFVSLCSHFASPCIIWNKYKTSNFLQSNIVCSEVATCSVYSAKQYSQCVQYTLNLMPNLPNWFTRNVKRHEPVWKCVLGPKQWFFLVWLFCTPQLTMEEDVTPPWPPLCTLH